MDETIDDKLAELARSFRSFQIALAKYAADLDQHSRTLEEIGKEIDALRDWQPELPEVFG